MRKPHFVPAHDSSTKAAQAALSNYLGQRARRRRAHAARRGSHAEQVHDLEQLARSLRADMESILAVATYDGPGRSLMEHEQTAFDEAHHDLLDVQRQLRRLRGEP